MSRSPLDKLRVDKFRKEIEPQEVLLDFLARKKEGEIGISEKKMETPLSRRILWGVWIGILILFFIFFGRTFQLQVINGKTLSLLSEKNRFVIKSIKAERGVLYDRNFIQLVYNKPSFNLICNNEIELENIDHETLLKFEVSPQDRPECKIENNTVREYSSGSLFSHLVGYLRQTGERAGLEKYYDDALSPKAGKMQVKRDARGNFISEDIVSMPESGNSLVLWLDSGLQKKLIDSLGAAIERAGADGGAAVVLDPKTGGVLALVNLPTFDNNLFSQGITQEQWLELQNNPQTPLFNRAVSGMGYPTGSTIKPLIGLAALEEQIISPSTKIYNPLEICVQNQWYPEKEDCYADWKYHGTSDLRGAIAESINTFFYQIGGGYEDLKGLGARKIKWWLENFGWGSKTGIDLPEEGDGILPNIDSNWRLGDTYHFSIGQGPFSITPLQVAAAYTALANKGTIYTPQLVKEIIDNEKNILEEIEPKISRKISVSPVNLEVVRQGMRQAVTSPSGSGHLLDSSLFSAAAKTGTAQTGEEGVYNNWVTLFAPYDDPQIVLTILVEGVKGDMVAVLPAAKEVLDWYFSQFSTQFSTLDPVRSP